MGQNDDKKVNKDIMVNESAKYNNHLALMHEGSRGT